MKNNLSIFNNLRPITVGFDDMFDHFEHMMDDSFFGRSVANFPPYNIVKTGENTYDVELALAGFNKKDIEVEYKENQLTVKYHKGINEECPECVPDHAMVKMMIESSLNIYAPHVSLSELL